MKFSETELKGLFVINLEPFQDERGYFSRIFCRREFMDVGIEFDFVQTNHSVTHHKGAIRGMHYQKQPDAEAKLIRCVRGAVLDFAIDLRRGSDTFLKFFGVELSEKNNNMIYIPKGFAHGFQTLEDQATLIYQHSAYYNPLSEGGIHYNDPSVGIDWPLTVTDVSEKDKKHIFIENSFAGITV
ncbi:UNVERIFIED_CONTAM: hypothetical protein GTU68_063557 [Idotea baltica]|nr:hypothetical protein [Idotea baltica]